MKDSKNIVIGLLCTVLCVMAVVYAAFSTTLEIEGTASISSTWGVAISDISCTPTKGDVNGTLPTATPGGIGKTDATLTVSFNQPGDKVSCVVTIANTGTLEAKLMSIVTDPEDVDASNTNGNGTAVSDFIWFSVGAAGDTATENAVLKVNTAGEGEAATAGSTHTYTIEAEYKDVKVDGQSVAFPKDKDNNPETRTLTVSFNYKQNLANQN